MPRLILLASLALVSCTDPQQPLSRDFGNSVYTNIAAQVVNPLPAPPGVTYTDGQRMDAAANRYRTNRVYQPRLPYAGARDESQPQQAQ